RYDSPIAVGLSIATVGSLRFQCVEPSRLRTISTSEAAKPCATISWGVYPVSNQLRIASAFAYEMPKSPSSVWPVIRSAVAGLLMIALGTPRNLASSHTWVLKRSPSGLIGGESSACHVK